MKTLVLVGGATLTFGSGRVRRTVRAGEPFEVADDLAAVLLADPNVTLAGAAVRLTVVEQRPTGPVTTADLPKRATNLEFHRELKARAKELGLPAKGKVVELAAAIAVEEARLAEAAASAPQGGITTPADDPGAVAPGEAGTPPEAPPEPPLGDMPSGAITLGDLPSGAVKGGG